MNQDERRLYLIKTLLSENPEYQIEIPQTIEQQKLLLRALMNVRMPQKISQEFLDIQDTYLQEETRQKGIVDIHLLSPIAHIHQKEIYLYKGDITTLACDAIVNAANSQMLGCFIPNHHCIDNCIHTYAGIQLRHHCQKIMQHIDFEKTGHAKITPAYNLPCQYIIHTVGPIITHPLTQNDCDLLASCYRSCLELANEYHLESIAFCCISTGEFHFPRDQAAQIAIQTVQSFLQKETSIKKVIFNVFKEEDEHIYQRLLANQNLDS